MLLHNKSSPVCCSGMICKQADFGSLFGWGWRPLPWLEPCSWGSGVSKSSVGMGGAVSTFGKEEGLYSSGQSLTISSHKESASPMNNPSCYSSLNSSWSGSLFRMISIPWVFGSKSVWRSFLRFVIPVFCVQSDLDSVGDSGMNGKKPISCVGNDGHTHCVFLKSHLPLLCCFPAHWGVLWYNVL